MKKAEDKIEKYFFHLFGILQVVIAMTRMKRKVLMTYGRATRYS